jgi:RND family efflux transporter MFP subunit
MPMVILRPFIFVGKWIKQHWKLTIFLLVLIGGGFWYWRSQQAKAVEVLEFKKVERGSIKKSVNVSGLVEAKQKALLRFAAGGKVVFLGAKEGEMVKKWQTIAKIDSRDMQKRMQQDLNLYFNERMDFEQNRDDRRDVAPTNRLDRMSQKDQKDLENTVLSVEIQDIAIRNTVLSSPIEGVLVTSPTTVTGVNLSPTEGFEVIDPNSLVFKAAVDEADISLIKRGQLAEIELDAYPENPVSATVSAVAYRSSQTSKGTVFVVELPIVNNYQYAILERYRLGMNGDVDITIEQKEGVLFISLDSLIERDGKKFVRRKNGENSAEDVEVQTGLETDDTIEITAGLQEGDEVVVP